MDNQLKIVYFFASTATLLTILQLGEIASENNNSKFTILTIYQKMFWYNFYLLSIILMHNGCSTLQKVPTYPERNKLSLYTIQQNVSDTEDKFELGNECLQNLAGLIK